MQQPDTLIVRSKTFKLSEKSKTLTYSGRVTDHVTGVVTHNPSGGWVASLVEKDPASNQSTWTPAIGEAATPQAALELVFDAANEIEGRFDNVTKERANGASPSRHDRRTREETHVEAEHDKLVRGEHLRMVAKIAIALAIMGGLAWAFLR